MAEKVCMTSSSDYNALKREVERLKQENNVLRDIVSSSSSTRRTMDESSDDQSMTQSDVLMLTNPKVAKPPNYCPSILSASHEEENDGEANHHHNQNSPKEEEEEHDNCHDEQPEERTQASSEVCKNDFGITLASDDTEIDGPIKGTQNKDVSGNEEEEDPMGNDGASTGEGGATAAEPWVMLPQEGEENNGISEETKVNEEDVLDLIDKIEDAADAASKNKVGGFEALMTFLTRLLPMVLFMADELKNLKEQKKELLCRVRDQRKQIRRLQSEAEKRAVITANKETLPEQSWEELQRTFATQAVLPENIKVVRKKIGASDPNTSGNLIAGQQARSASPETIAVDDAKREVKKLRHQLRELLKVNHSWEKHCSDITAKHEIELKEKQAQLASSEERRKKIQQQFQKKLSEYDGTLLLAKERTERSKASAAEYQKDRDRLQKKNNDLNIHCKQLTKEVQEKNVEIRRLNEIVDRGIGEKQYKERQAQKHALHQQACLVDDDHHVRKAKEEKQRGAVQSEKRGKQPRDNSRSPPLSPRGPPATHSQPQGDECKSLSKEDLKDKVMLYREQMDAFRSDFLHERRDREKAVGQVDSLKQELDKTKKKLKEIASHRKQEEMNAYRAAKRYERMLIDLPEETQEMRMREVKQQARSGRKVTAHGRLADELYGEGHFYEDFY